MIRESLAGKRVAVTGGTGFLGTALVERLLRAVPDCELVLVIRAGRRSSPARRAAREIFANDAFRGLKATLGDRFDDEIAQRVHVVAGDVTAPGLGLDDEGRELLAGCHTVIHAAARVSFDSPIDSAVNVNLLGPLHVVQLLQDLGSTAHLIAVSTAYVAGSRRGRAPEAALADTPFSTDVSWRSELEASRRARPDADAASRAPDRLAEFTKAARAELGAAGTALLSAKAERRREQWVEDQLIEAGRSRAHALGWPDAYAYTKALAEAALLEMKGEVPVTIVRPSIIESSVGDPFPGWIRGFRMAEPVIIALGRGVLREFPGVPEGVVDVVPVDLVVAALVTLAARGPSGPSERETEGPSGPSERETEGPQAGPEPDIYHVTTGARNPLRYRRLVDLVQDFFREHPLYDAEGQPIVPHEWSYALRGRAQRQLERGVKALHATEKLLTWLPIRGRRAEVTTRVEERRGQGERALDYVKLYGAYAETEAVFDDTRTRALWLSLDADDQAEFCFDSTVIDWPHYVLETHLPSIVEHARVRTTGGPRTGASRFERGRAAVLSPDRHMAAFDLENTLIASNVVESYAWLATRGMPEDERARFTALMLKAGPGLLALDRRDRGDFLRHFYRRYEGAPAGLLRDDAWEMFSDLLLKKSFPAGFRRVREHRALGHRTVLITGALDFVVEPLRPLFDDVVCTSMEERDGFLTGELVDPPPTGEARALVMADYAASEGLSLAESVAYADSTSDLPMLEAVGFPVAVNAEAKLAGIARKRGWHIEQWTKAPGGPRPLLPLAPRALDPKARSIAERRKAGSARWAERAG